MQCSAAFWICFDVAQRLCLRLPRLLAVSVCGVRGVRGCVCVCVYCSCNRNICGDTFVAFEAVAGHLTRVHNPGKASVATLAKGVGRGKGGGRGGDQESVAVAEHGKR